MKAGEMTDHDLDSLFDAAREARASPSPALMARVMADAVALQPKPVMRRGRYPSPLRWLDRLAAPFGGGGALAGISFAMLAGVFIGVVQPAPVAALTSVLLTEVQYDTVDLLPGDMTLWEEAVND
jgi:hypothetical protein